MITEVCELNPATLSKAATTWRTRETCGSAKATAVGVPVPGYR